MSSIPTRIGRYEIKKLLGGGGMGVVYEAHDPQIGRDVAIKQVRAEMDSPELRDRMLREVRASGRLRHPNIVSTFDIGEHDGNPFIVMELIEGRTLEAVIHFKYPPPLRDRLHLMEQLCAGLAAAHDAGIVHRDVKPANLIVDPDGTLKIVDFGIARLAAGKTATAAIGTANYMAPEQWTGHGIDARADIFAAGAVFYEVLSGRKAFPGNSLPEICQRIMNESPVPLEAICDGLDPQLVQIVNRMLNKEPANRFDSLTPIRSQLQQIRARLTKSDDVAYVSTILMRRDELQAAAAAAPVIEGPAVDLSAVERRRTAQIESHLRRAHIAFDRGDFQQAAASCEDVLVLDPNQGAALDLLKKARRLQSHRTAEKPALSEAVKKASQPVDISPAPPAPRWTWPSMRVSLPALIVLSGIVRLLIWAYEAETTPSPRTAPPPVVAPVGAPPSATAPASQLSAPGPIVENPTNASRVAAPPPVSTPSRGVRPPVRPVADPPPPPPPPPAPVRVGGAIKPPQKTKDVPPIYPQIAQSARVQGVVIVEATIGATGKVENAKVLRSIPLLDAAAVDAVKQWEFTPTLLYGVPTPVIMTVTVNFSLRDEPPAPTGGINVEGLEPDAVVAKLGQPSSTQMDYSSGIRIWYYDRPEGTLTVYFSRNNRASRRRPQ